MNMSWTQAVAVLANRSQHSEDEYEAAVHAVLDHLPAHTGKLGSECEQEDWVREGDWSGIETIESSCAEWLEFIDVEE